MSLTAESALKYLEAMAPEGYDVTVRADENWALFEVWPPKKVKNKREQEDGGAVAEDVRISYGISPVALGNMDVGSQDFTNFLARFFPWGAADNEVREKVGKQIERKQKREAEAERPVPVEDAVEDVAEKKGLTPKSQQVPNLSEKVENEPTRASELNKKALKDHDQALSSKAAKESQSGPVPSQKFESNHPTPGITNDVSRQQSDSTERALPGIGGERGHLTTTPDTNTNKATTEPSKPNTGTANINPDTLGQKHDGRDAKK